MGELNFSIYLSVLKTEWGHLLKRTRYFLSVEETRKLQVEPLEFIEESHPYFQETKRLFESYEEARRKLCDILRKNFQIEEKIFPSNMFFPLTYGEKKPIVYFGNLRGALQDMEKEIQKTLALIDGLSYRISLPESKKGELRALEEILEKEISSKFLEWASDLKESIKYFREGYLLGAVLIAGRVITAALDKINSRISKETQEKWKSLSQEEKSEKWWNEARNILKIDTKEEHIMKGIKLYRQVYSHKPGTFPSIDEVILILSGTVGLVKKLLNL